MDLLQTLPCFTRLDEIPVHLPRELVREYAPQLRDVVPVAKARLEKSVLDLESLALLSQTEQGIDEVSIPPPVRVYLLFLVDCLMSKNVRGEDGRLGGIDRVAVGVNRIFGRSPKSFHDSFVERGKGNFDLHLTPALENPFAKAWKKFQISPETNFLPGPEILTEFTPRPLPSGIQLPPGAANARSLGVYPRAF